MRNVDADAVVPLGLCKSGVAGSFLASATALQVKSPIDAR
ncbi:MAG: hypothetical protein ACI856_002724 [Kiritimatiellia bacterium]|jgi:hypothetical protein